MLAVRHVQRDNQTLLDAGWNRVDVGKRHRYLEYSFAGSLIQATAKCRNNSFRAWTSSIAHAGLVRLFKSAKRVIDCFLELVRRLSRFGDHQPQPCELLLVFGWRLPATF